MDYGIFEKYLEKVSNNEFNTKVIDGDLTESDGALVFDGNVVVNGKVLPNAVIEASGDVIVRYFEFAQVYAKGFVYADLITGAGNDRYAIVRAKKGVIAGLIQYANVISYYDVDVSEEVRHSDIFAESFVNVNGGIIGGLVSGFSGVEADFFGLESKIETKIVAGYSRRLSSELENKKNELEVLNRKIEICRTYLEKIKNKNTDKFNELSLHFEELNLKKMNTENKINEINTNLKTDLKPEIRFNVEVNEGVSIAINNAAMIMDKKYIGKGKFIFNESRLILQTI